VGRSEAKMGKLNERIAAAGFLLASSCCLCISCVLCVSW